MDGRKGRVVSSPQGHRSLSVSYHFVLQAPQCPCSVQKQFSRETLMPKKVKNWLLDCGES